MATKKENQRQALLVELELHKIEFASLRQEVLQWIEAERQYLNLCLVAIGAGLGFASYIANEDLLVILLLFPFVFHILLWEMLKVWRAFNWISMYLVGTLIPRVNYIVNELGDPAQQIQVLGWERYVTSNFPVKEEGVLTFLGPGSHFIPILAISVLVAAFLVISNSSGHMPSPTEWGLVIANVSMLIFEAMQSIALTRSDGRRAKIAK
jgi:hypothetical protein